MILCLVNTGGGGDGGGGGGGGAGDVNQVLIKKHFTPFFRLEVQTDFKFIFFIIFYQFCFLLRVYLLVCFN